MYLSDICEHLNSRIKLSLSVKEPFDTSKRVYQYQIPLSEHATLLTLLDLYCLHLSRRHPQRTRFNSFSAVIQHDVCFSRGCALLPFVYMCTVCGIYVVWIRCVRALPYKGELISGLSMLEGHFLTVYLFLYT